MNSKEFHPMPEYVSAWKTFRQSCDENKKIAEYLVGSGVLGPRPISIVDVGCGDGHVLYELLTDERMVDRDVERIVLVDPDGELLNEAISNVFAATKKAHLQPVGGVQKLLGHAHSVWPDCAEGMSVALLVHVVYLLKDGELEYILAKRPPHVRLIVVMDNQASVFTQLWKHTATIYYRRSVNAHRILKENGAVRLKGKIESRMPLRNLRRGAPAYPWILSFMCYSDMQNPNAPELDVANGIIEAHANKKGGYVSCFSDCYVIG